MKEIKAKTVVVTGAGGGMGKACCKLLAEHNCKVIGIDVKFSSVEKKGVEIPLENGEIRQLLCDVTSPESVDGLCEKVKKLAPSLDAVIHTAGIYDLDSLIEMDEARFTRIFNVNLFGVYRINKGLLPLLSEGSRIIMITSELAAVKPLPFTGVYAVTKTALERYAYSLRMEVNLLGISVSVVRPGAVDTGLLGDSTRALDKFCDKTELYSCNADRFRRIVNSVEAKKVAPEKLAKKVFHALYDKKPRYVYNINRNVLLKLLHLMPSHFGVWIIKKILEK